MNELTEEESNIQKQIRLASERYAFNLDAHLIESVISLFNNGVLTYFARTPRTKIDKNNLKMTIEGASGVVFTGRDRLIEMERQIDKLEAKLKDYNILMEKSDKVSILMKQLDDKIETNFRQFSKIQKLETREKKLKDKLNDFILEDNHSEDCPLIRFSNRRCECMDRDYYNRYDILDRAKKTIKELYNE